MIQQSIGYRLWSSARLAITATSIAVAALLVPALLETAKAEEEAHSDLAKQTQNPVSNLISVPFQNNTNFGVGPRDRTQNVLNIQPVIPVQIAENWLLINRTIVPLVYQPDPIASSGGDFGLSDINHTTWIAPKGGKIVWGVGPTIQLPTSVNDRVGPGKFGLGPSAVVVAMPGKFVVGGLVNNVFSLAGDSDTPYINAMTLQPFLNYNLPDGWFLVSAPIINADWQADSDERWLVPLGGGFGKVFQLGAQAFNAGVQGYWNAERPTGGPETTLRVVVQLLFPK